MSDTLQPILAVIFVLSLLGGVLYLLRRRGMAAFTASPGSAGPFGRQTTTLRQMKVLERTPLGPHHALHLVRVGERLILVATAPGFCQILDPSVRESGEL